MDSGEKELLERLRGYVQRLWPATSFIAPSLALTTREDTSGDAMPTLEERTARLCVYRVKDNWTIANVTEDDVADETLWSGYGIGPCAVELTTILLRRELRKRIGPILASEQARRDAAALTRNDARSDAAPGDAERAACPDGGTCHHGCATSASCFRVQNCSPISGVYPDDEWPASMRNPDET